MDSPRSRWTTSHKEAQKAQKNSFELFVLLCGKTLLEESATLMRLKYKTEGDERDFCYQNTRNH